MCGYRVSFVCVFVSYKMENNGFLIIYLIIVMNWFMVSFWGMRNFVLLSNGRFFFLWYFLIIICNEVY